MTQKVMRMTGIVMIIVVITAVLTTTINRVRAAEAAVPVQTTAAQVGNSFTYQGSLEDGGAPVNGNCDFQFSLFDAASGGSQVGITLLKSNVAVSDGVFAVDLDFGDQFTGDARYLAIAVSCPASSGSFTTINGRVSLNAAPYALSLRPGATIQGTTATTSTLRAINQNTANLAYGVYGEARSSESGSADVAGVHGRALSSSDTGSGVYGQADGINGTGVYGFASPTSGETSGVYGQVWSNEGVGVYGVGVITGTYGYASAYNGVSYGVYGDVKSSGGYGVYSNGNAHVEGDLTWKATTSYLSIPAAALQPNDESMLWDIASSGNYFYSDATNSFNRFMVPVYLPHNATITGIKTWWEDSSINDATLMLRRLDPGSAVNDLVTLNSSGNTGSVLVSSSTTITDAVVDNSQYSYILYIVLPDENINYYQTVIEYTTTGPN